MAKLTSLDILKLAQLARLQLTGDEQEQFRVEIEAILGYVEQLQNIDLTKIAATNQVTGLENVMRVDEVKNYGASPNELLENVPATAGGLIKVRRVL